MKVITTEGMPAANGHYSQCIEHNGLLYLSGQLPIEPGTRNIPDSIEEQADLALKNVERILREAGVSKNEIIQVRIYIADIIFWDAVNACYAQFFGTHKPVRTTVPVGALHFGCKLELEVLALAQKQ